ncbi:MAG: FkbM family methyltransferase [Candidatus Omnitrophica bacterium]|nr:FkbM family methyltransferase [Candidatus Omnitrophota bacterium]
MMKKLIRKNVNLFRHYGIFGACRLYAKIALWHIRYYVSSGKSRYKKVRVNDYEMFIDLRDSGISKALFVYGTREKDQMGIVKSVILPGMRVLDIGANIGYYVIMESRLIGSSGKIIAYEPSADNCALLKKNLELNNLSGKVELNEAAVSDKAGTARFYVSDKSNLHTLNPSASAKHTDNHVEVKTADIYEIIGRNKDIGFIRMDIEGHEVEVLKRLGKAVTDFKVYPKVLFETHFPKYNAEKHNICESLETLFHLGYTAKILTSTGERATKLWQKKYKPEQIVKADLVARGIYKDVLNEDVLGAVSIEGGVRAVLLVKD